MSTFKSPPTKGTAGTQILPSILTPIASNLLSSQKPVKSSVDVSIGFELSSAGSILVGGIYGSVEGIVCPVGGIGGGGVMTEVAGTHFEPSFPPHPTSCPDGSFHLTGLLFIPAYLSHACTPWLDAGMIESAETTFPAQMNNTSHGSPLTRSHPPSDR